MKPFIAIISHLRPENVPKMHALTAGTECTWFVGVGEEAAYRAAGAGRVIEGGGLCASRNAALREAFKEGRPCVQLSDDLTGLKYTPDGKNIADISFEEALEKIERAMSKRLEYRLAGIAPTQNAFYFHTHYSLDAFILGDFIYVRPCDLFFDESLRLKEDYDYSAQHVKKFGGVVRVNGILGAFAHRTNKGGAVATRTAEIEQESILRLMRKHPGFFRMNPRRPNEILWQKASQRANAR